METLEEIYKVFVRNINDYFKLSQLQMVSCDEAVKSFETEIASQEQQIKDWFMDDNSFPLYNNEIKDEFLLIYVYTIYLLREQEIVFFKSREYYEQVLQIKYGERCQPIIDWLEHRERPFPFETVSDLIVFQ